MSNISIFERFRKDSSGNVAMIFGFALIPILAGAGAAIDYSRSSNVYSAVVAAADAGALAAAAGRGTPAAREAIAKQVFEANLKRTEISGPVRVTYQNLASGSINTGFRIEAKASVKTTFGGFVGTSETEVGAVAQASSAGEGPTEIAFVLDTTDSMEGDRIATLKTATNAVIDEITSRALRPELVKFGVVPFGQYVNVGMGNRNAPWIDVRADYQTPEVTTCSMQFEQVGEKNCRNVNYPYEPAVPPTTCMRDGRRRPCGGSPSRNARIERTCDPIMSTVAKNVCTKSGNDWVRWNGCVGSRNFPLNTVDGSYGTKIPGILGIGCATPLLDLTTNVSTVRSTINALITEGETYIPSGLIWGWRMLSPGAPLSAATGGAGGARKFMILVTDGRNTKSPNYPAHEGSDSALADQLTKTTCSNIAGDTSNAIKVFTIAFEMDGLDSKAILQECARRTGGQFFDATDAAKLKEAFSQVSDAIATVKLTY
jgi:Flp pilus assembly protein TadG